MDKDGLARIREATEDLKEIGLSRGESVRVATDALIAIVKEPTCSLPVARRAQKALEEMERREADLNERVGG